MRLGWRLGNPGREIAGVPGPTHAVAAFINETLAWTDDAKPRAWQPHPIPLFRLVS